MSNIQKDSECKKVFTVERVFLGKYTIEEFVKRIIRSHTDQKHLSKD